MSRWWGWQHVQHTHTQSHKHRAQFIEQLQHNLYKSKILQYYVKIKLIFVSEMKLFTGLCATASEVLVLHGFVYTWTLTLPRVQALLAAEVRGQTTYKQQSSQVFDQNLPIAHKGKHAKWSRSHGAQGGGSCRELLTKSWLAVATSRTNKPWSWLVQQQGHHWMWNSWYSVISMQLGVELTLSAGTACIAHLRECCQWCVYFFFLNCRFFVGNRKCIESYKTRCVLLHDCQELYLFVTTNIYITKSCAELFSPEPDNLSGFTPSVFTGHHHLPVRNGSMETISSGLAWAKGSKCFYILFKVCPFWQHWVCQFYKIFRSSTRKQSRLTWQVFDEIFVKKDNGSDAGNCSFLQYKACKIWASYTR